MIRRKQNKNYVGFFSFEYILYMTNSKAAIDMTKNIQANDVPAGGIGTIFRSII